MPISATSFYVSGYTSSTTGISTPFSLQPNLNYGIPDSWPLHYNMFVARFDNVPLGVSDFNKSTLQLLPNPNNGNFVLQGNLNEAVPNSSVLVYDLQGREMFSGALNTSQVSIAQEFHLQGRLSTGVYFVKVVNGGEVLRAFKMAVRN